VECAARQDKNDGLSGNRQFHNRTGCCIESLLLSVRQQQHATARLCQSRILAQRLRSSARYRRRGAAATASGEVMSAND
jgi:hypothetical protein